MVVFTGTDKALLDRGARILDGLAKATGWESIADSRKRKAAKAEFDRLTRDARDLRMLGLRLKGVAKSLAAVHVASQIGNQETGAGGG